MSNKTGILLKTFLMIVSLIFTVTLSAQIKKTVKLVEAGSLSSALTIDEKLSITDIVIVGKIDLRDLDVLNEEIPNLAYLNMEQADIIKYRLESAVYAENELPSETFMYNKSLKKVILPQSLKVIGYNSFMESYVEEVVLGDNIIIINDGCFSNCERLKKINIPSSVKQIGKDAFANNGTLKDELAVEE